MRLCGTREVSQRIAVRQSTASELIQSGRLPGIKIGHSYVVDAEVLEVFATSYDNRRGRRKGWSTNTRAKNADLAAAKEDK